MKETPRFATSSQFMQSWDEVTSCRPVQSFLDPGYLSRHYACFLFRNLETHFSYGTVLAGTYQVRTYLSEYGKCSYGCLLLVAGSNTDPSGPVETRRRLLVLAKNRRIDWNSLNVFLQDSKRNGIHFPIITLVCLVQ